MRLFKDLKNVKKNWRTIQSSPYASLHFKYKTTFITMILFSAFIVWQIIKITLNYTGFGWQTWIMRIFTLGIGVLIISKSFQSLAPLKRAMDPYKKNKKLINHTEISAKIEINDLLNQFNKNGKRINQNHPKEEELNSNKQKK